MIIRAWTYEFEYTPIMRFANDLDPADVAILASLKKNARISNKDLAETVGLAPSTCLERVRRLVDMGAVHGFHADVDLGLLGFGLQAMIAVRLQRHSRELVTSFRDYVLGLAEVQAIYHVAGADDYLVHVAVHDADHLRDLALDAFTTRREVAHIETRLIFEHMDTRRLPISGSEWP
jgi:DNA-binding Lrp family transcriptional regulator